jgi:hypothetical protein
MQRRRPFLSVLCRLGVAALVPAALAADVWAQRPTNPIARPPLQPPNRPWLPGRFGADGGGTGSGQLPGIFTVVAVHASAHNVRLRDETGRNGVVHVQPHLFDLASLHPGDQVEVDFLVAGPGSTKLEAGGMWKVERQPAGSTR